MIDLMNEDVLFVLQSERKNPVVFKQVKKDDFFVALNELSTPSGFQYDNLPPKSYLAEILYKYDKENKLFSSELDDEEEIGGTIKISEK